MQMAKNTTANEETAAIDPGGTKPAKSNAGTEAKASAAEQKVKSGDRNTMASKKK
jgi:hypothetical protein